MMPGVLEKPGRRGAGSEIPGPVVLLKREKRPYIVKEHFASRDQGWPVKKEGVKRE